MDHSNSISHLQDRPQCCVKGCIFPASPSTGLCRNHARQKLEPAHFKSFQPTLLVVQQATFNLADDGTRTTRAFDRRRLETQTRAFHDGLA